jgi:uncharacterized membrane protein
MGLLSDVLLFPIAGPVRGLVFILERLQDEVEAELADESRLSDELMDLTERYESGELSEDQFQSAEEELIERLDAIRRAGVAPAADAREEADDASSGTRG